MSLIQILKPVIKFKPSISPSEVNGLKVKHVFNSLEDQDLYLSIALKTKSAVQNNLKLVIEISVGLANR